jgi:hypothetical protein
LILGATVTHQTTVVLHVDDLGESMTRMREWLDDNRYEADVSLLYQVEGDRVTVQVEFIYESQAAAFAHRFGRAGPDWILGESKEDAGCPSATNSIDPSNYTAESIVYTDMAKPAEIMSARSPKIPDGAPARL